MESALSKFYTNGHQGREDLAPQHQQLTDRCSQWAVTPQLAQNIVRVISNVVAERLQRINLGEQN